MTIEKRLTFAGKVLKESIAKPGQEYSSPSSSWYEPWHQNDKTIHIRVLDDDSIGLSTRWSYEPKKTAKEGRIAPANILKGPQINGLKIPHPMLPGFKYELSWTPTANPPENSK